MKILDVLFSSLVLCISSLPLILLILALQRAPAVPENRPLDQARINEIQQLLIDHDPRQLLASDYQEVRLTESEVNALAIYVKNSNPVLAEVNVNTDLVDNGTDVHLSIPVEVIGLLRYVNLTMHFTQVEDGLTLDAMNVGALDIPSPVMAPIRAAVLSRLSGDTNFQLVSSFLDSIHIRSINDDRVVVELDWQEDNRRQLQDQARQVFVSAREAQRLLYFHDRLVDTLAELPGDVRSVSLNDLLRPLFLYAGINSDGGASPVAENRAVFIVLTAYLTDLELEQFIGDEVTIATPRQVKVVIDSREDLPQHVVSSAAIAVSAGVAMAEVLSIYKEVHDSRYRTGFSFTDIAANQAGTMLGLLASRSAADARLFQDRMANSQSALDYLPDVGTYDGMTEAQFMEQYGSRESEAYLERLAEITDSIAARPFFAGFGN